MVAVRSRVYGVPDSSTKVNDRIMGRRTVATTGGRIGKGWSKPDIVTKRLKKDLIVRGSAIQDDDSSSYKAPRNLPDHHILRMYKEFLDTVVLKLIWQRLWGTGVLSFKRMIYISHKLFCGDRRQSYTGTLLDEVTVGD